MLASPAAGIPGTASPAACPASATKMPPGTPTLLQTKLEALRRERSALRSILQEKVAVVVADAERSLRSGGLDAEVRWGWDREDRKAAEGDGRAWRLAASWQGVGWTCVVVRRQTRLGPGSDGGHRDPRPLHPNLSPARLPTVPRHPRTP